MRQGPCYPEREMAASRKGAADMGSAGSCLLLFRSRIVCSRWMEQVCKHAVTVNVEEKKKTHPGTKERQRRMAVSIYSSCARSIWVFILNP